MTIERKGKGGTGSGSVETPANPRGGWNVSQEGIVGPERAVIRLPNVREHDVYFRNEVTFRDGDPLGTEGEALMRAGFVRGLNSVNQTLGSGEAPFTTNDTAVIGQPHDVSAFARRGLRSITSDGRTWAPRTAEDIAHVPTLGQSLRGYVDEMGKKHGPQVGPTVLSGVQLNRYGFLDNTTIHTAHSDTAGRLTQVTQEYKNGRVVRRSGA
jgi:hypothetical protein